MKVMSQSSRRERMTDVMGKRAEEDKLLAADGNYEAKVARGIHQIEQGRSVSLEELAERLEVRKPQPMEATASIA